MDTPWTYSFLEKKGLFEKALLYVQINFIDTGRNCHTATYLLLFHNNILVPTFPITSLTYLWL
jgi:hypothetical protein